MEIIVIVMLLTVLAFDVVINLLKLYYTTKKYDDQWFMHQRIDYRLDYLEKGLDTVIAKIKELEEKNNGK